MHHCFNYIVIRKFIHKTFYYECLNASTSANLIFFILQHISCSLLLTTANLACHIISVVLFRIKKQEKNWGNKY